MSYFDDSVQEELYRFARDANVYGRVKFPRRKLANSSFSEAPKTAMRSLLVHPSDTIGIYTGQAIPRDGQRIITSNIGSVVTPEWRITLESIFFQWFSKQSKDSSANLEYLPNRDSSNSHNNGVWTKLQVQLMEINGEPKPLQYKLLCQQSSFLFWKIISWTFPFLSHLSPFPLKDLENPRVLF